MDELDVRKVKQSVLIARDFRLIAEQGLRLDDIKSHTWKIMTCSAVTGKNLKEGLAWVVQDAKDRLFLY